MSGRPSHRPAGAAAALRAVLALVTLIALCVGIPLLLIALAPTSFPHGVPGPVQLFEALTRRDDGTIFLAVLTLAAWVGWATFAVAVLLEVPAQLRGVPPVRVRGLGVQQSLAGALVAAALSVALVPTAASAAVHERAAGPVAATTVASASGWSLPDPGAATTPTSSTPAQQQHDARSRAPEAGGDHVHVVRSGDTLWDLAAEHLGDGGQWRRIATLNYDRVQPDGSHLGRDHVLRPGWRLELPTEAAARRAPSQAGGQHVVRPGETLSGIAQHELGDAGRYPELARATEPLRQPDGRHLTDPDLILPGWRIQLPGKATGDVGQDRLPAQATHAGAARTGEAPDPLDPSWGGTGSADTTQRQSQEQPGPGDVPLGTGEALPAFGGRMGAPAVTGSALDAADEAWPADADVRTAAGTGALLAASLVGLLGARRARQRGRRRPGERIPLPGPEGAATEARLRAVADPTGLADVDAALRSLGVAIRAQGRRLPTVRLARLTQSSLELHLTEPGDLPGPWGPTGDPAVWVAPRAGVADAVPPGSPAPYPALVTLGHDVDGGHVLVDLESVPALGLTGRPQDTVPVLAAVAVELATSPWADDLLVTLVGCLSGLPGIVGTGRLRHVEHVEQVVADLEGRAADVERLLHASGVDDLAAARSAGVATDAWSPEILVLAQDVPPELQARLERVLLRLPRVGLAAVTGGGGPSAWQLQLSGETARLEPPGVTLRPQRLAGAEYQHVLELLRLAAPPGVPGPAAFAALPADEPSLAHLPTPARSAVVDPPVDETPEPPEAPPPSAPVVELFGPVRLVGAAGPEPVVIKDGRAVANHLGRATALVAFLACTTDGATTEQVAAALSPVRRLSPATIWSLASRTRKWLGNAPDGTPYYPRTPDAGAHRLHSAVRTDWSVFLELVGDDVAATPTPRLVEALALVRGRPFDGVSDRHYSWSEPLRQEMTAAVVDVAHEVADRALAAGDAATARRASRVGRTVDPLHELLWRDGLRAEYVAGNREAQRRLAEQLHSLAGDLDVDLERETEELLARLEPRAAARAAR